MISKYFCFRVDSKPLLITFPGSQVPCRLKDPISWIPVCTTNEREEGTDPFFNASVSRFELSPRKPRARHPAFDAKPLPISASTKGRSHSQLWLIPANGILGTDGWQRPAWEAAKTAPPLPEPRYPIIVSDSGPFSSPSEVLDLVGPPAPSEVKETTKAGFFDKEQNLAAERVRYCDVTRGQWLQIQKLSEGEDILVWFNGGVRSAWVAAKTAAPPPEGRYPIIICGSSAFRSRDDVQEVAGFPAPSDVKETTKAGLLDTEQNLTAERVRYCDVTRDQWWKIKGSSKGESVLVWFDGRVSSAWVAHAVTKAEVESTASPQERVTATGEGDVPSGLSSGSGGH